MSVNKSNLLRAIVVVALACAFLGVFHGKLIGGLNTYLLGDYEDGLKNYYSVLYHVQHDSTWSHFNGMNYPYGEQVLFTDGQPWLAMAAKVANGISPEVGEHSVALVNGSMLLSLVLCCWLMFLLFREYKLPPWYSVLAALLVGMLSPQLGRFGGHYALAHAFVVPLAMLLVTRFANKPTIGKSIGIAVMVFAVAGLHFYFFAISAFFISFWFGFRHFWPIPSKKELLFVLRHWSIQVVLPFVLLQVWIAFTDTVADRPANPWGFLVYKAHWESVFLPLGYPLGGMINAYITEIRQVPWEGIAYVGLPAAFLSIGVFFRVLFNAVRWRSVVSIFPKDPTLRATVGAGIALLLFSMGFPFVLGIEGLLDYTGPLKQFRGIGRFAWVFYYTINLWLFVAVFHRARLQTKAQWRYALLVIPLLALAYEVYDRHANQTFYRHNEIAELQSGEAAWSAAVQPTRYQAILPLPYFHIGSENLGINPPSDIKRQTMVISSLTGLPTTAIAMSRTSLNQTFNNLEFVLGPKSWPTYLENLPSTKPFLLAVDANAEIPASEQWLLYEAELLWQDESLRLMELSLDDIGKSLRKQQMQALHAATDTNLTSVGKWKLQNGSKSVVVRDYSELQADKAFSAPGALSGPMNDYTTAFEGALPAQDTIDYIFSMWVYMREDTYPHLRIEYTENNASGEAIFHFSRSCAEQLTAIDGDWGLIELPFKPTSQSSSLLFNFHKDHPKNPTFWADDLLIRPADCNVFSTDARNRGLENGSIWNNRTYAMPEGL